MPHGLNLQDMKGAIRVFARLRTSEHGNSAGQRMEAGV